MPSNITWSWLQAAPLQDTTRTSEEVISVILLFNLTAVLGVDIQGDRDLWITVEEKDKHQQPWETPGPTTALQQFLR